MKISELPTNVVNQKGVNLGVHAVIIDAFDLNKGNVTALKNRGTMYLIDSL